MHSNNAVQGNLDTGGASVREAKPALHSLARGLEVFVVTSQM